MLRYTETHDPQFIQDNLGDICASLEDAIVDSLVTKTINALKKLQKEGLPEDVEKDSEETVQKDTDNFTKKVDELLAAKEKEIMTV